MERPRRMVRFARLIHRRVRVLGGPAARAACGDNLSKSPRAYNYPMSKQTRWRWSWRRWLSPQWRPWVIAVLVVLFAMIWWLIPPLLYRHTATGPEARLKAITDTRTALLAGLIGLGALLTFQLNSRGQMTDRYTKAIDQLGANKLDVRLGGIYALEHIADDSPSYHPTIVEVLSVFAREHSDLVYRLRQRSADFKREEEVSLELERRVVADDVEHNRLPNDVQAAVIVLGRLPNLGSEPRGDLHQAHLASANLHKANLSRVDLSGADLQGAILDGANLQEAGLRGAQLQGADLRGTQLNTARANPATTWPKGFDLGRAGVVLIVSQADTANDPEN
jgi:hypothetical protein